MEREIKFRVWDNVDYMSSPFTLSDLQSKQMKFTSDCEVMQFTGLKDKNGKDVYEGDILIYKGAKGSVIYDNSIAMFMSDFPLLRSVYSFDSMECEIEIIGNIHENPELLNN